MNRFRAVTRIFPSWTDLARMRERPGTNLLAGLTVAIVALPLALGFGVASGVGAEAGLVTAIIAGVLAAVFGGSNLQVSGPTGAMTVVIAPVVAQHGTGGVLMVGLLAGVVLIVLAAAGVGRYMTFIPAPVVVGFTAGIAVVIGLQQVPAALGLEPDVGNVAVVAFHAVVDFIAAPHWAEVGIAVAVLAVMLIGGRWRPGFPFSLAAIAVATPVALALALPVKTIGALPATLPAPNLDFVDLSAIPTLAGAAIAVAALSGLESLLSATVADGMTVRERHHPDRELFGQGVANVVAPMFGGVAATAAIARTAVNVKAGASTRLAAISHSIILALAMLVAAPLVAHIPLAALAGVLIATAVRMVQVGSLRALGRATRSDAVVMGLTAVMTVALDLVVAVLVGLLAAVFFAVRNIARSVTLDEVPLDVDGHSPDEATRLAEDIVAYRWDGPLFFAAAHRFLAEPEEIDAKVVILRMSRVSTVDASGALVVKEAIEGLERRGVVVLMSGVKDSHRRALTATGVLDRLDERGRLFTDTEAAVVAARLMVLPDADGVGTKPGG